MCDPPAPMLSHFGRIGDRWYCGHQTMDSDHDRNVVPSFVWLFSCVLKSTLKINLCVCNKQKSVDKTYPNQIWQFRSCNTYFTCNCLPWRLVQNMIYLSAEFDLNFFWCVQPQCIQYIRCCLRCFFCRRLSLTRTIPSMKLTSMSDGSLPRTSKTRSTLCEFRKSLSTINPKKTMRVLITNRPKIQKLKFKIRNSVIKIISSNHRG